jgi:preprotein translocase subunit SecG
MQAVLIIIQLLVSVALIGAVLLQRSEGGALGMGGGGGGGGLGSLFSPRGAADTLTRTTAILAILFFLSSLGLTLMALHGRPQSVLLDSAPTGTTAPLSLPKSLPAAPGKPTPAVPAPH